MAKPSRSKPEEPKQEQLEQVKAPPPCASCNGTGFVDEGIYVPSLKPCQCRA